MYSDLWTTLGRSLAAGSPTLLVYLAGVALAAVLWRRHRTAAVLLAAGIGLLLVETVAVTLLVATLMFEGYGPPADLERRLWWLSAMQFVGNALHAVGIALLLAAAFVGRKPPAGP